MSPNSPIPCPDCRTLLSIPRGCAGGACRHCGASFEVLDHPDALYLVALSQVSASPDSSSSTLAMASEKASGMNSEPPPGGPASEAPGLRVDAPLRRPPHHMPRKEVWADGFRRVPLLAWQALALGCLMATLLLLGFRGDRGQGPSPDFVSESGGARIVEPLTEPSPEVVPAQNEEPSTSEEASPRPEPSAEPTSRISSSPTLAPSPTLQANLQRTEPGPSPSPERSRLVPMRLNGRVIMVPQVVARPRPSPSSESIEKPSPDAPPEPSLKTPDIPTQERAQPVSTPPEIPSQGETASQSGPAWHPARDGNDLSSKPFLLVTRVEKSATSVVVYCLLVNTTDRVFNFEAFRVLDRRGAQLERSHHIAWERSGGTALPGRSWAFWPAFALRPGQEPDTASLATEELGFLSVPVVEKMSNYGAWEDLSPKVRSQMTDFMKGFPNLRKWSDGFQSFPGSAPEVPGGPPGYY